MNVFILDYPLLFCLYPFVFHLHFPRKRTTTRVYKTHLRDFDIRNGESFEVESDLKIYVLNVNYLSRSGVMS